MTNIGAPESSAVAVIGAGPAGLTAAITLAHQGIATVLIGAPQATDDNRTTALLAGSVATLESIGAWRHCAAQAAPLRTLRIVDDTGRLIRAPEVKFEAAEIGLDAFGHNIENRHLVGALAARARELPALRQIDGRVTGVETGADGVIVRLEGGKSYSAALAIGADGRGSICRAAAGIKIETRDYPQSALALSFAHTRPHHDCSTEFQTASGPFTQVPLPGLRSSLVWVLDPRRAEQIGALDDDELSIEIERRCHSIFGKVKVAPARSLFPLSVARAHSFAQNRVALVGEAAHVIPPIGAQGLNLGLRDAAAIGELAIAAHRKGGDIGAPNLLEAYDSARRADVTSRTWAVDLVNRSLLTDFLPVQAARGLGLYLLDRVGPLRRAVMREGVSPQNSAR